MRLTATTVRTLKVPPDKSEATYFDDDLAGVGLRRRERGSGTFIFQYQPCIKQRHMALGAATALNVGDGRKTAERLHARVKPGEIFDAAIGFEPAARYLIRRCVRVLEKRSTS